jgi:hypothetical protein
MLSQIAKWFDDWKKITGGIVGVVAFLGLPYSGWLWIDTRYAKAADMKTQQSQLSGQLNYQINELKLGQVINKRDFLQAKYWDIEAQASRNKGQMTDVERRYYNEMARQIEEANKEIDYLQGALRNQAK